MNKLDDMRYMVEIAHQGSFSAAAKRLGVSKQLVSRRVLELEARLGVQLLIRTTRSLTLTDFGFEYLEYARNIVAAVDEAEQLVSSHRLAPRGLLRLSAPISFGTIYLSPLVADFLIKYPDVRIELDLTDRLVDLIAEGFDMAVRIGFLPDSSLIARKLVDLGLVICASPEYLARKPPVNSIEDLKKHQCLLYGHDRAVSWLLNISGALKSISMTGIYKANNGELIRKAAIAGLGLAQMPDFIVEDSLRNGELVTILDGFAPQLGAAYVIHPPHRQRSRTVRALADHFVDHFRKNGLGLSGSPCSRLISSNGPVCSGEKSK